MPTAQGKASPVFKVLASKPAMSKLPLKVVHGVLKATKSNPAPAKNPTTATSKVPFKFSNKANPAPVTKISKSK